MAKYQRTGICNDCGDCCGANGVYNTSLGWEVISKWDLADASESYNLWMLFGLHFNSATETIEPETENGQHKIGPNRYYYTWKELRPGKGHLPCKDISLAHDGSSFNVECPFLQDDPGDGSRPCGLKGTGDEGARWKFCRPEEHPTDYVPENDIWDQRSKEKWEADHPNCSYIWVEILE